MDDNNKETNKWKIIVQDRSRHMVKKTTGMR